MRSRLVALGLVFLSLMLFTAFPVDVTGAEFKLKYAHVQPEKHVTNLSALWMAQEINKRTKGRVEMSVYPGGVLGPDNQLLDSLQAGDIDFAWISSANLATSMKEFNVFSLSYLFKDFEHYKRVMAKNSYVMKRFTNVVENSPYGIKMVGVLGGVSRQFYNKVRPISAPDDLKGIKLRVQQSPVESKIWASLGAVPQQLAWTEIYTGLQTGVIQGAESSMDAYFSNKFYEVAPNFAYTNHQFMVLPLLMSKKTFNKLPKDLRDIVAEVAYESGSVCNKLYLESEDKLKKEAAAKGIRISYPNTSAFQARVADIVKTEAARYNVEDVIKAIQQAAK